MKKMAARMISALIPHRKLRHKVRNALIGAQLVSPHVAEIEKLHRDLHRLTELKPLADVVAAYQKIGEILTLLTPYTVIGTPKVRVGGDNDGGYVMLDPGRDGGVAYSLGVSAYSPWDLDMAERGFHVFQFDGTIDAAPDSHPNLHFQKLNIVPPDKEEAGKSTSLSRLFRENGHESNTDLILQIDIEGGEWDVFGNMPESELRQFRQILVEYHDVTPFDANWDGKLRIMEKLSRTHKPIHIHLNNCCYADPLEHGLPGFSNCWEVTYARTDAYAMERSGESFPTPLDSPNIPDLPELTLWKWR